MILLIILSSEMVTICISEQLYSGNTRDDSQQIARLCGHQNDQTYTSSTNQMLVVMRSDFSDTLKGFHAQFWTSCGTTVELTAAQPEGTLTSDMVYRYPNALECNWTLRAANPDERIVLTFLEVHNTKVGCENAIHIHELDGDQNTQLQSQNQSQRVDNPAWLCESDGHRTPYTSASSSLALTVVRQPHTNSDAFRFRLHYALLSTGCGRHFHAKHGDIASPGYPDTYELGSECVWTIGASRGQRLQLTFAMLDVAESERCNEAYVEVRETDAQGQLLGIFCGKQAPPTLRASSFWLKFHAGSADTGRGFRATYNHEQLVELSGEIGELQSPLYPNYDIGSNEATMYRILVPIGSIVAVRMQELVGRSGGQIAVSVYNVII